MRVFSSLTGTSRNELLSAFTGRLALPCPRGQDSDGCRWPARDYVYVIRRTVNRCRRHCHTFLLASGNCRLALTQSDLDDQESCTYRSLQVHSCTSGPTDPLVAVFSALLRCFVPCCGGHQTCLLWQKRQHVIFMQARLIVGNQ